MDLHTSGPALSLLLADILDRMGMIVSGGHRMIKSIHIYCDDTDGWSWGIKTQVQDTELR